MQLREGCYIVQETKSTFPNFFPSGRKAKDFVTFQAEVSDILQR
jgi:hypothetical protein